MFTVIGLSRAVLTFTTVCTMRIARRGRRDRGHWVALNVNPRPPGSQAVRPVYAGDRLHRVAIYLSPSSAGITSNFVAYREGRSPR